MQDKQKVTLYLPPELHRQLKIRAAVDSETMTDIAQKAIIFYLSNPEIVEQHERSHGQVHRVYSCPDCESPVVLRDGVVVSLSSRSGTGEDSLLMEKAQTIGSANADSHGEGELVPC